MKIARIIDEFFDYRAYVSHTLWKQRLFLGLDSSDHFTRRMRDGFIWPLVPREAQRMLQTSCTLFGIDCEPFRKNLTMPLGMLERLETAAQSLSEGDAKSWDTVRSSAEQLRDALANIPADLESNRMTLSEQAVEKYLSGHGPDHYLDQAMRLLRDEICPLLDSILGDQNNAGPYQAFWPKAQEVRMLLRTANVAAFAAEKGGPELTEDSVRRYREALSAVEAIVQNWSPLVEQSDRLGTHDVLKRHGFASPADVMRHLAIG